MSYSRSYSTVVRIPYSGTVSNGQVSLHYSGTAEETVHVNVIVDTDDFDRSADHCGTMVDALTASVVATETAHTEAIRINSSKISKAIVSGFFKTVRSELGQQIAQLKSSVDATLLHLNQMAKRCTEKHKQMETDYGRITERYSKIFTDLNKELELRVFELDRAAFKTRETATDCANRTLTSSLAGEVAVSAGENSRAQAMLLASVTKSRANQAIALANNFLQAQQQNRNVVNRALHDTPQERHFYVPVCMAEGVDVENPSTSRRTLYKPSVIPNSQRRRMTSELGSARWKPINHERMASVKREFNRLIASEIHDDNPHTRRVKEMLNKFIEKPLLSL